MSLLNKYNKNRKVKPVNYNNCTDASNLDHILYANYSGRKEDKYSKDTGARLFTIHFSSLKKLESFQM